MIRTHTQLGAATILLSARHRWFKQEESRRKREAERNQQIAQSAQPTTQALEAKGP